MKRRTGTALVVTLLAAWLSGCGAEQPSAPATSSAPMRASGLKIVMIAKNTTNPIFVSARKGAEVAAKELVLLIWRDLQTILIADKHGGLGLDDCIVESASLVAGEGWQKVRVVHRLDKLVTDPHQISCRVFETMRLIVQGVVETSDVISVPPTFVSVLEEC